MPSETGRRDDVSRQIEVHIHRTTQHNNGPERTNLSRAAVFVRAPILKRVGGAALPSFAAAAIFHSQTSFLRGENRKSGACYNKRQYCITQKRARDTGRGTPSLGMQHSAGRSLAPRCGIREEERDTKEFRHGAQACAHGQAAFALSEAAARNAHCCDLFKRRFKRQRAGDGGGGSFALFSAAVKKEVCSLC